MLIAIFAYLMMGSSFGMLDFINEKEDVIADVVLDQQRQQVALETTEKMKARAKSFSGERTNSRKEAKKLLRKNAEAGVLEELLSKHFENYDDYTSDMLDLRFELKAQITEEEWNTIFSTEGSVSSNKK